ncbi:hypothetical protein A3L09_05550 [Thermococcus profundus]|uniref:Uncharacterized protein n=1 Tax=Thermococcus profundus TaxID=49899 RepID=A0A2Z2MB95_THEPR|nr:hypothetical protein [Thermococcus profundus]ASJ02753.1 hypothetical protein A3L09_05550 [Thermococcus profundus]
MKKLSLGILFVLLFSFFAYNAYTYHELSTAEGAYKLAGIPKEEGLIAVYHENNLWQFATYNEKTNMLKLYTVSQSTPFWLKSRRVESSKTLVNYSSVILDLEVLKDYTPHERALLFKTIGWKYDDEIDGSYWWNLSEVIKPNETFYQIYALGTSKEMWIRSKEVLRRDSRFAGDTVGYGSIGVNGVLVFPSYKDTKLLWVKEKPGNQNSSEVLAYYPGVILRGLAKGGIAFTYRDVDQKMAKEIIKKLETKNPKYVQLIFYETLKRVPGYYAFGRSLNGGYCQVEAKSTNPTNITDLGCISNIELR